MWIALRHEKCFGKQEKNLPWNKLSQFYWWTLMTCCQKSNSISLKPPPPFLHTRLATIQFLQETTAHLAFHCQTDLVSKSTEGVEDKTPPPKSFPRCRKSVQVSLHTSKLFSSTLNQLSLSWGSGGTKSEWETFTECFKTVNCIITSSSLS